jgi:hypothetical protein
MAKKEKHWQTRKIVNLIGWYGAIATLTAYFLVSFEIVGPKNLTYQILNLSGAIGLGIICDYKKTFQPLFVNTIWAIIALVSIINIVFFIK